jgi:hypothetical protein
VTVKTKSGATYDDLVKVPETFVAEIVEGDLFASPPRCPRSRPCRMAPGADARVSPARTLEIFRRSGAGWVLVTAFAEDEVVHAEPFEAIELDLLLLWGEQRTR